ncbi:hypothetical protein MJG53_009866 [Ovis ammon polii x Ovis aries]|uniref:Uncharacterized protein n=1 Tax=Ovis ammon polii x Ovis aries TaxID=2918886 RepID=A0ACB9UVE1_9CETA|nr:hypothetical protein MJG53_009866 [Ovis ammon polii x Ovis aries]
MFHILVLPRALENEKGSRRFGSLASNPVSAANILKQFAYIMVSKGTRQRGLKGRVEAGRGCSPVMGTGFSLQRLLLLQNVGSTAGGVHGKERSGIDKVAGAPAGDNASEERYCQRRRGALKGGQESWSPLTQHSLNYDIELSQLYGPDERGPTTQGQRPARDREPGKLHPGSFLIFADSGRDRAAALTSVPFGEVLFPNLPLVKEVHLLDAISPRKVSTPKGGFGYASLLALGGDPGFVFHPSHLLLLL